MFNKTAKKTTVLEGTFPPGTVDITGTETREYCQVMQTTNYGMFSLKEGNRPIRKPHLRKLTESIAIKQLPVPIIVDEFYRICDGQNRFTACKNLKKPIHYIVVEGLNLDDVQRLNANTKTWSTDDYMDSFCELGLKEYIIYKKYKDKYKFGHNESLVLLGGYGGSTVFQNFRDGNFKVKNYSQAIENSDKILEIGKYYDGYRKKLFVYTMMNLLQNKKYNHSTFLRKLSRQSEKMRHQADVESYLRLIEKIYNHGITKKNKVRLY